jgi:hypothetical protein
VTAPLHPMTTAINSARDMSARLARREGAAGGRVSVNASVSIRPYIAGSLDLGLPALRVESMPEWCHPVPPLVEGALMGRRQSVADSAFRLNGLGFGSRIAP